MLVDKEIRTLIEDGVLSDADPSRVGPISYDLRNYGFYQDGRQSDSVSLLPGDSVFVGAEESILLPNDLAARVGLKNSRIRQGLACEAPVYFPGHATRVFFRVTNISADVITLDVGHDISQIFFERLESEPETPYAGSYADEFDFRGLGSYRDVFGSEISKIEHKAEKIEHMEQRIYGNVIAIMGVFIAVFSLVNVDLSWMSAKAPVSSLVILNLSIVGGMSALVGLISTLLGSKGSKATPWILASISFAVAIALLAFAK